MDAAATADTSGASWIAALHDGAAAQSFLVQWSAKDRSIAPLGELAPRLVLDGPATSVHCLGSPAAQVVVAVLADGRVACFADGALSAKYAKRSGKLASGPVAAAASSRTHLVLAHQRAHGGEAAVVEVFELRGTELASVHQASLHPASSSATVADVGVSESSVLLLWSDNVIVAAHGLLLAAASTAEDAEAPSSFQLPNDVMWPSSAAGSAAAAEKEGKKRKNPAGSAAAAPSAPLAPKVLMSAVDDTRAAFLQLQPGSGGDLAAQLRYAVLDTRFGCMLAAGSIPLEGDGAADLAAGGLPAAVCSLSPCGHSPGNFLVCVSGFVFVVEVPMPQATLLSLVGRLAVSSSGASAAHAPPQQAKRAGGKPQEDGNATVGSSHNSGIQSLLAAAAGATAMAAGYVVSRVAPDALHQDAAGGAAAAVSQHSTAAQLQQTLAPSVAQKPSASTLKQAAEFVLQQVSAAAGGAVVSGELIGFTCTRLAEAGSWDALARLVRALPPHGLSHCPSLLEAVADAKQYSLLAPLCIRLDELPAGRLVAALQVLLAPTSNASVKERKQYFERLQSHAEAAVRAAETAARHHGGGAPPAPEALALAKCAAAAVDGFSYRDVLLHPLLAMHCDAVAVQASLRELSNRQVDALLAYLGRWLDKYTNQLGDAAAGAVLPEELVFPTFGQVLDWMRMVIDAHLARLLMQPTGAHAAALRALHHAVQAHVEGSQRLLALRGIAEHVRSAAPLPEVRALAGAASNYHVRVLDLGVVTD